MSLSRSAHEFQRAIHALSCLLVCTLIVPAVLSAAPVNDGTTVTTDTPPPAAAPAETGMPFPVPPFAMPPADDDPQQTGWLFDTTGTQGTDTAPAAEEPVGVDASAAPDAPSAVTPQGMLRPLPSAPVKPTIDRSEIDALINQVTQQKSDRQLYRLQYKLPAGRTLKFKSEHYFSTRTRKSGMAETSTSRSESVFRWDIKNVDAHGNMTLVHTIDWTRNFTKVGDGEPVNYDSRVNDEIPDGYHKTARTIGIPLSVVSVSPLGEVMDKKTNIPDSKFGAGQITIPLPNREIPVGYEWNMPHMLTANDDGRSIKLEARTHYELARVKGNNAYISFRTEVLSPIENATVESQIMQKMTSGYIVFDMNLGCPVRREAEWDEKVQGSHGTPDLFLSYVGKWSETMLSIEETLDRESNSRRNQQTTLVQLTTRNGRPVMRK